MVDGRIEGLYLSFMLIFIWLVCCISGVHYVFDTAFSRNFSLLESQREFLKRFSRKEEDKKALPMLASACPGNQQISFILRLLIKMSPYYILYGIFLVKINV